MAIKMKRGTTQAWSYGPELIKMENSTAYGADSIIHMEGTNIQMYVYTTSANYWYTKDPSVGGSETPSKIPGLKIPIALSNSDNFHSNKPYRLLVDFQGPSDCTFELIGWSGILYKPDYSQGPFLYEGSDFGTGYLAGFVKWPAEKVGIAEPVPVQIRISLREINYYEELEEGQLGLEYTIANTLKIKAGMPGITKWDQLPYLGDAFVEETPANEGIFNAIRNMQQICEFLTYPITTINLREQNGTPAVFTPTISKPALKGLPYASSKNNTDLMVPLFINFDNYKEASQRMSDMYAENTFNGFPAYGSSCTAAISYALGLKGDYPTNQYPYLSFFVEHSFFDLQLGDIVWRDNHAAMIVRILRDTHGNLQQITTGELTKTHAHYENYSFDDLYAAYEKLYRYTNIANVQYVKSPWVAINNETTSSEYTNSIVYLSKFNQSNYSYEKDPVEIILSNTYQQYGTLILKNDDTGIIKQYGNVGRGPDDPAIFTPEDWDTITWEPGYYTLETPDLLEWGHEEAKPQKFAVIHTETYIHYQPSTKSIACSPSSYNEAEGFRNCAIIRLSNSEGGTIYTWVDNSPYSLSPTGSHCIIIPDYILNLDNGEKRAAVWVSVGYITKYGTIFTQKQRLNLPTTPEDETIDWQHYTIS